MKYLLKLLEYIKQNPDRTKLNFEKLDQIKGLAFLKENSKLKVTDNGEALKAYEASEIHYPNYDKLREGLEFFEGNGEIIKNFFWTIEDIDSIEAGYLEQQLYPEGQEFFDKTKNKKIAEIMSAQDVSLDVHSVSDI